MKLYIVKFEAPKVKGRRSRDTFCYVVSTTSDENAIALVKMEAQMPSHYPGGEWSAAACADICIPVDSSAVAHYFDVEGE